MVSLRKGTNKTLGKLVIWRSPVQLAYAHINVVWRDFVPKLNSKIGGIFLQYFVLIGP